MYYGVNCPLILQSMPEVTVCNKLESLSVCLHFIISGKLSVCEWYPGLPDLTNPQASSTEYKFGLCVWPLHRDVSLLFASSEMKVQLDLGYPASSYPDISIIRLRSCSVYCLFFIHFHIKILLKTKTKWTNFCFISFYMYVHFIWMIICYKYSSNE